MAPHWLLFPFLPKHHCLCLNSQNITWRVYTICSALLWCLKSDRSVRGRQSHASLELKPTASVAWLSQKCIYLWSRLFRHYSVHWCMAYISPWTAIELIPSVIEILLPRPFLGNFYYQCDIRNVTPICLPEIVGNVICVSVLHQKWDESIYKKLHEKN